MSFQVTLRDASTVCRFQAVSCYSLTDEARASLQDLADGRARELRPYSRPPADEVFLLRLNAPSRTAPPPPNRPTSTQAAGPFTSRPTASSASTAHIKSGGPQVTNKLIQSVFKLQTEVTRLKADVDRIGGPADTVEHRQKIAAANARIKTQAKQLGEFMKQQALDKGSFQMQKILNNFQVRTLLPCSRPLRSSDCVTPASSQCSPLLLFSGTLTLIHRCSQCWATSRRP